MHPWVRSRTWACRIVVTAVLMACSSDTSPLSRTVSRTGRLAAGGDFTCALNHAGAAFCWGEGGFGQLGNGSASQSAQPVRVQGGPYSAIVAADQAACALRFDGMVDCWGLPPRKCCGQASYALLAPAPLATSIRFTQVSLAGWSACGIDRAQHAFCWGAAFNSALGNGESPDTSIAPAIALRAGHAFAAIAQGAFGGCGIDVQSAVWCWGADFRGELGVGDAADTIRAARPMKTAGDLRFVQISVGGIYTCGVTTTGVTECWGDNVVGQLGDGTLHDRAVPTPVAGGAFVAVFAGQPTDGADHTCALDASGAASCWGANELGQLGATGPNGCGSAPCSTTPVAVTGGVTFTTLALGNSHTCGMGRRRTRLLLGQQRPGPVGRRHDHVEHGARPFALHPVRPRCGHAFGTRGPAAQSSIDLRLRGKVSPSHLAPILHVRRLSRAVFAPARVNAHLPLMLGDPGANGTAAHRWLRSRTFCRLVLVPPVASIVYGIVRTHRGESVPSVAPHHAAPLGSNQALVGALVALVVYGPLAFACWEIGREHTTARRMGFLWIAGLGDVVKHAVGREPTRADDVAAHEEASRAPPDNPWAALAWAAPIAVIVPPFFALNVPMLRAPIALGWLTGAGVIMASAMYFRRRAIPYLLDEPSPWAMFSGHRFLDESRYAEPGRVFIHRLKLSGWLLVAWWLGIGILVMPHVMRAAQP